MVFTTTSLYLIEGTGVHKEQAVVWFEYMLGEGRARFYMLNAHGPNHRHDIDINLDDITVLAEWPAGAAK